MQTNAPTLAHLSNEQLLVEVTALAARRWPVIIDLLADGSVSMTAVRLLAPHLTDENHSAVLATATHKSKREVEQQVAALRPLPPVPSTVRKLPAPTASTCADTAGTVDVTARITASAAAPAAAAVAHETAATVPAPPARRAVISPLAPERFKVQFTASREMYDRLRRAQDLLRHAIPDGDPAVIFHRALTLLLADLEKRRLAQTARPRKPGVASAPSSRYVPASVRREVWARDAARCAFVGPAGRCTETGFLELHHLEAFADGGETTTRNLQLRCRAHNVYEAEARFGRWFVKEPPAPAAYGACDPIRSGTA